MFSSIEYKIGPKNYWVDMIQDRTKFSWLIRVTEKYLKNFSIFFALPKIRLLNLSDLDCGIVAYVAGSCSKCATYTNNIDILMLSFSFSDVNEPPAWSTYWLWLWLALFLFPLFQFSLRFLAMKKCRFTTKQTKIIIFPFDKNQNSYLVGLVRV